MLELTYRDTFGSDFCLMMVVPSLFEEVIGCSGTELPYRIIIKLVRRCSKGRVIPKIITWCYPLDYYVVAYLLFSLH